MFRQLCGNNPNKRQDGSSREARWINHAMEVPLDLNVVWDVDVVLIVMKLPAV